MNKIFFQPAAQTSNTGDLLINVAILNQLRNFGEVVINDIGRPNLFIEECLMEGVRPLTKVSKMSMMPTIQMYLKEKKAGDNVYLFFPPGHTSKKGIKSAFDNFKKAIKLFRLKQMGCKIVKLGFSIGPFDKVNGVVESLNSRMYKNYGLREEKSLKLAEKFRFKNVSYFPDFAWAYTPKIAKGCNSSSEKDCPILLSFRSNEYGLVHNEAYLDGIKNMLMVLLNEIGKENKIIIMHQVESDQHASRSIYAYLKDRLKDVEIIDRKLGLVEASTLYSNASLILSNRLHVLLLGMINGAVGLPLINTRDNKKIIGIFNLNKLDDLILDYEHDEKINISKINKVLVNIQDVKIKVREVIAANASEIENKMKPIFDEL